MHLIGNAQHNKEDSNSSSEMMINYTKLVSDDCYTEGWGKRLLFINQFQLVPAMRDQVIKMNCTVPDSRTDSQLLSFFGTAAIL